MTHEIRCKRIIDSKTYNTETATLLGHWESTDYPAEEALFKTRHGAYFLYKFLETVPDERIEPLAPEAAQKWMEQHCRAELIEAEFGEMPEAGDPEARITLRIPETLRKRLAAIAEDRKQSLNAWIQRCLERCAAEVETGQ
jgi:predicted HicB family RNase H-like nuclease